MRSSDPRASLQPRLGTKCALTLIWPNPRLSSFLNTPIKNASTREAFLIRWRRRRDSNPRYAINVYSLSRGAPSATRPLLRILALIVVKITMRDPRFRASLSKRARISQSIRIAISRAHKMPSNKQLSSHESLKVNAKRADHQRSLHAPSFSLAENNRNLQSAARLYCPRKPKPPFPIGIDTVFRD